MLRRQGLLTLLLAMLASALHSAAHVPAADTDTEKKEGKVAGILLDKKDNFLTIKADGQDEPEKYAINSSDKKLAQSLKMIFNASRVQVTYKKDGDERQLTSIRKQILRATGVVTGTVVKVHDNFWVEVKPKDGVPDAYAPDGRNFNNKAFMDLLRGLKPGDSVTIQFATDLERHRILALRKN